MAANRLERRAGRVGVALVVARDHPHLAAVLDAHLRRAEDVTRGVKRDGDAVDFQRLDRTRGGNGCVRARDGGMARLKRGLGSKVDDKEATEDSKPGQKRGRQVGDDEQTDQDNRSITGERSKGHAETRTEPAFQARPNDEHEHRAGTDTCAQSERQTVNEHRQQAPASRRPAQYIKGARGAKGRRGEGHLQSRRDL